MSRDIEWIELSFKEFFVNLCYVCAMVVTEKYGASTSSVFNLDLLEDFLKESFEVDIIRGFGLHEHRVIQRLRYSSIYGNIQCFIIDVNFNRFILG